MAQQSQFPPAGTERYLNGERYVSDGSQFVKQVEPTQQIGIPGQIAQAIKRLPTSPMVPEPIADMARATVASPFEFAENPNWETGLALGANVASLFPMGRAARAAAPVVKTGMQALRQIGAGAARSAAGGAVGGAIDAAQAGGDPGMGAVTGAVRQGGVDLVGGGVLAGLGGIGRGLGRRFAVKAVNPSSTDLINWRDAYVPRPDFHTNPGTFVEGDVRRKFTDELEREALTRPGWSSFGGVREADDAILRADITGAQKEDIVRRTVTTVDPPSDPNLYRRIEQAAERGDGPELQQLLARLEPVSARRAEFAVNLDDIAATGRGRARELGGAGGGSSPYADRRAGEAAVEAFLARDRDARPVVSPWLALPEPRVAVPLGGTDDGLRSVGAAATPAAVIPNLERGPRSPVGRGTGIGSVMASHTPTSVLPTPPQFLGESASVVPSAPQPTGGSLLMDAGTARAQGLTPPLPVDNTVGFDTALRIRQNLDRDLLRSRQGQVTAASAGQTYVPSPQEEVQHTMREALREALNNLAPQGQDLRGVPVSLENLLAQERKDIVMAQIKAQATGDPIHAIRARGGFNPQSGAPAISVFENFTALGGGLAKPMIRGAQKAFDVAPITPQLARLAALLAEGQVENSDIRPNLSGFVR